MNLVVAIVTQKWTLHLGLCIIWHLVASPAGKSEPTMSVLSFGHLEILQIAELLLVVGRLWMLL